MHGIAHGGIEYSISEYTERISAMKKFITTSPAAFDAIFDKIGKEMMLISTAAEGKANTMTASWGCCGMLWNRPVALAFIRPQRHTFSLLEKSEFFSLAFLDTAHRGALQYCGTHTGRGNDKFKAAGLSCTYSNEGIPYPEESQAVLLCRKLYAAELSESAFCDPALASFYTAKDFHKVYVGEILNCLQENNA